MKENIKLLKKQIWKNGKCIIFLMILSIAISLLSLTVPWFMQYFTDKIIIAGKWEKVTSVLVFFVIITLLRYIADMGYEKLLAYVTYDKVVMDLRKQASHMLVYLDTKYLYKKEAEVPEKDMESILLGDIDAFRNVLSQTIKFFTEVLKLVVYVAVLFFYSVPVGILVCMRIPLYYGLSALFDKPLSEKNEEKRSLYSKLIQKIKKVFVSLPVIKTLCIEHNVYRELLEMNDTYTKNQKKTSLISVNYQELNTVVNTLMNILVLLVCGNAILHEKMTLGTMMLISNIQSRTTMPLFFFNNYYLQYKSCFPSISRLVKFLSLDAEVCVSPSEEKLSFEKLEVKNIAYQYEADKPVLKAVNMQVSAGDKIILTGDNMVGKSTFLKLLAGLLSPDAGEIVLDGKALAAQELRKYVTLFVQNQEAYSYFENQGSGGEVMLENLSLMEKTDSPILLLDEADASVNEKRLKRVYRFLESDATVILITHRDVGTITKEYPHVKVWTLENFEK